MEIKPPTEANFSGIPAQTAPERLVAEGTGVAPDVASPFTPAVMPEAAPAPVKKSNPLAQEVRGLAENFNDNHVPTLAEYDKLQAAAKNIVVRDNGAVDKKNRFLPREAGKVAELASQDWRLSGDAREQAAALAEAKSAHDLPEGVRAELRPNFRDTSREVTEKRQAFLKAQDEAKARLALSDELAARDAAQAAERERQAQERTAQARAAAEAARQQHKDAAATAREQRLAKVAQKHIDQEVGQAATAAREQAYGEEFDPMDIYATGHAQAAAEKAAEDAATKRRAELAGLKPEDLLPGNSRQDVPKDILDRQRQAEADAAEAARLRAEELKNLVRDPSISRTDWFHMTGEQRQAANQAAEARFADERAADAAEAARREAAQQSGKAEAERRYGDANWFADFQAEGIVPKQVVTETPRIAEPADKSFVVPQAPELAPYQVVAAPEPAPAKEPPVYEITNLGTAEPDTADTSRVYFNTGDTHVAPAPADTKRNTRPSPADDIVFHDFDDEITRINPVDDVDVPDWLKAAQTTSNPANPNTPPATANTAPLPQVNEKESRDVSIARINATYDKATRPLNDARKALAEATVQEGRSRFGKMLRGLAHRSPATETERHQLEANYNTALNNAVEAGRNRDRALYYLGAVPELPPLGGVERVVDTAVRKTAELENMLNAMTAARIAEVENPIGIGTTKTGERPQLTRRARLAERLSGLLDHDFSILDPAAQEQAKQRNQEIARNMGAGLLQQAASLPEDQKALTRFEQQINIPDALRIVEGTEKAAAEAAANQAAATQSRIGRLANRAAVYLGLGEPNQPPTPQNGTRPRTN